MLPCRGRPSTTTPVGRPRQPARRCEWQAERPDRQFCVLDFSNRKWMQSVPGSPGRPRLLPFGVSCENLTLRGSPIAAFLPGKQ